MSAQTIALLGKLHEVANAIDFIEKRGENKHHKYDFVQAVDVTREVRAELLKRDIIVLPGAENVRHLPYGEKGAHLTTVDLTYRFTDVKTGVSVTVPWAGAGTDIGGDKGLYKAFTGGLKYMLMNTFLIPATNDPERDQLSSPEGEGGIMGHPGVQGNVHKDDFRPPAPTIPLDRASEILARALKVNMASYGLDAEPGTPPEFAPTFSALLALQGVTKIGQLNVDQAEAVEAWLTSEEGAPS